MLRRFRVHDQRQVTELSGIWDFAFLGGVDAEKVDVNRIAFREWAAVPGSFDATPEYAGRRGLAAYRTRILLKDEMPHRLVFDGVHHWCRVFVGGQRIRDHAGGFTPFHAELTDQRPGETALVVLVDNRFNPNACPLHLEYFDWYQYGGLTRRVELHRLGKLWIEDLRFVTLDYGKRRVRISFQYNSVEPPGETILGLFCNSRPLVNERVTLTSSTGVIERELELTNVALWSPEEPNLHFVQARLGEDDMRERVGVRQVQVKGREILINGKPQRLLGVNRHEAHPEFGHGLPAQVLVEDMQLLKRMGCNFVRGSHYPQDARFLDLCDEAGVCVWCEGVGWQHTEEHLTDRSFLNAQRAHLEEMVASAYNRPSVICWGLLNESCSHQPASRAGYSELLELLRTLDPSRPVTYATCHPLNDQCLDLADFVGVNLYPGWYSGTLADIPAEIDRILKHLDAHGCAGKPILISEIGAEGIRGHDDWHEDRWTETYQAKLLAAVLRHLFTRGNRVCGLSIWQFHDVRSTEAVKRMVGRGRGFNNKGLVDEYRRAKRAFEVVRRYYHSLSGRKPPGMEAP